jgi:hypothetical protein
MLTTTDVAGQLGYSDESVRRMCESGCFDGDTDKGVPGAFRLGVGAHWRIPPAAVDHFRESLRPKVVRKAIRKR